ncbi:MAG: dephospho-CoA kinase [Muribaculaceae bacterium]|nr:dephospho-CoA kinase [Muribaculaceae bacterium]
MMIGICGGIGSGKSVVSRILRLRGEAVYDCDLNAKRIMDTSAEVIHALHARYGDSVCPAGGPICRPALSERVFSDEKERLWLNNLVHHLVRDDVERWHIRQQSAGKPRAFVEAAILASSGLAALCSEIWLVSAPEDVRLSRVSVRDGHNPDHIRDRIRAQDREEDLLRECGVPLRIIDNSGSMPLMPQI